MTSDLDKLCERLRVHVTCQYGGVEVPEGWAPGTHPYKVRLQLGKRSLTVPFFCGPAHDREPTAADVLSCLCLDASTVDGRDFEDFCSDLGLDPDSRQAKATYDACVRMAPRVRRFLGEHFQEVTETQH